MAEPASEPDPAAERAADDARRRRIRLRPMAAIGVALLALIAHRELGPFLSDTLPPPILWTDDPTNPHTWREEPARAPAVELDTGDGAWSGSWPPEPGRLEASWELRRAESSWDRLASLLGWRRDDPKRHSYVSTGVTRDVDGVVWFEFRRFFSEE